MCIYIYIYTSMHLCIYVYLCVYVCVCMYVCVYIYIYIYMFINQLRPIQSRRVAATSVASSKG